MNHNNIETNWDNGEQLRNQEIEQNLQYKTDYLNLIPVETMNENI